MKKIGHLVLAVVLGSIATVLWIEKISPEFTRIQTQIVKTTFPDQVNLTSRQNFEHQFTLGFWTDVINKFTQEPFFVGYVILAALLTGLTVRHFGKAVRER